MKVKDILIAKKLISADTKIWDYLITVEKPETLDDNLAALTLYITVWVGDTEAESALPQNRKELKLIYGPKAAE